MTSHETQSQSGSSQSRLHRVQSLRAQYARTLTRLGRRWNQLSYVRGILFLSAAILVFSAWVNAGGFGWPTDLAAIFSVVLFLAVALRHDRVERDLEMTRLRLQYVTDAISRMQRRWKALAVPELNPAEAFQGTARDLDLFGATSLVQLLGTTKTSIGLATLRDWICHPALPDEIRQRQGAVAELRNQSAWREAFQIQCDRLSGSAVGPDRFIQWVHSSPLLDRRSWLLWIARFFASWTLLFSVGFLTGWMAPQVAGIALLAGIAINFMISVYAAGAIHEVFNSVSSRKNEVDQFRSLFQMVRQLSGSATWIRSEQSGALGTSGDSTFGLQALSRIMWLANLRRHGVLFLLYVVLQFGFLWDIHILAILERWQRRFRPEVPRWFRSLARIEVVAALGTFADENPEFAFPTIDEQGPRIIRAQALGHPLLAPTVRVCNDVTVGPVGQVLLVTGSNMSGKSTLLRSIGVNCVLAQLGGPVCARAMQMYPVAIETSMRIADSLADGVSFFMAELKRLKAIVDRSEAVAAQRDSGQPLGDSAYQPDQLLFLLDEVLQGTNSKERHVAVCAVISQLLRNGAIGAVTTHDLDLARADDLGAKANPVYFTESFVNENGQDRMIFDYVMRHGLAPTTNAIKLLRLVGLTVE